jgi:2-oxoacid:acceptor oxidoreductase delta subunit (pyruvate/2-ketoisovalerate family)
MAMSVSKVYFTNLRTNPSSSLPAKMERLVKRAGIETIDFKNQYVAIKIHFGEPGNLAYLRPNYAARLAVLLHNLGAKPFLTDSNTLYSGGRSNAVDHLQSAMENGFNPISAKCNVIIADGVKGIDYREVPIGGEYCKAPKIGTAIADADIVISMNHFKGHEQSGFGGALKNLGMGSASVGGKLELHSSSQPVTDHESCTGCKICEKYCAHNAIHVNKDKKASIDYDACVGCGQCVALCQYEGVTMGESDTSERLNCKIAEYAKAVVWGKPNFHVNFIMNVSPECDCWNHNDAAIIPDLGILSSFDPVALDQACADMVIAAPALSGSRLAEKYPHEHLEGKDKFRLMHPDTHWQAGLVHGEKIGLGTREYKLITV